MIDPRALSAAIETHGRLARIVIAGHKGSTPRETGTSMLVWDGGQAGTIGGGRLELAATARALELLTRGPATELRRQALGPALGQCCGGSVVLVTEIWDAARYRAEFERAAWEFAGSFVRRVEGSAALPERLRRRLAAAAESGAPMAAELAGGWLAEPVGPGRQRVCIYGAGHVGCALARVLDGLPEFEVVVADHRPERAADLPETVRPGFDRPPHAVMAEAPPDAAHFIMTPEHEYDLELCHRLLSRRFGYAGLIGSATKWARFRKRLAALGHSAAAIDQIECPIGDPGLGKHPQAIAIGVAARLLERRRAVAARGEVA